MTPEQERVRELEKENAALREVGPPAHDVQAWSSASARIFGAPLVLVEERTLDAALDDALLEEILDVLRTRFATVGTFTRTTQKGAITWHCGPPAQQRIVEITIKPDGARTKVRIVERVGQLAVGLFAGIVGGLGGGVGLGFGVPLMIETHSARLLPFAVPAMLLATWLAVRAGFRAAARRRANELANVMAEIARAARLTTTPKTRVVDPATDATDESGDTESARSSRSTRGA